MTIIEDMLKHIRHLEMIGTMIVGVVLNLINRIDIFLEVLTFGVGVIALISILRGLNEDRRMYDKISKRIAIYCATVFLFAEGNWIYNYLISDPKPVSENGNFLWLMFSFSSMILIIRLSKGREPYKEREVPNVSD